MDAKLKRPAQRRQRQRSTNSLFFSEQTMWPDRRLIDLFKTEFPIVLAPMAGVMDADLVAAAARVARSVRYRARCFRRRRSASR